MSGVRVTVSVRFDEENLRELWDARDWGAIAYWAVVDYRDGYALIREREEVDERFVDVLNRRALLDGLTKVVEEDFQVTSTLRKQAMTVLFQKDTGELDADLFDVIVQAWMFGEIVYG